jgi:hypothetical protein
VGIDFCTTTFKTIICEMNPLREIPGVTRHTSTSRAPASSSWSSRMRSPSTTGRSALRFRYIYLSVYLFIYLSISIYLYIYIYISIYLSIYTYTYIYIYIYEREREPVQAGPRGCHHHPLQGGLLHLVRVRGYILEWLVSRGFAGRGINAEQEEE